ncbi:hypothetical protein DM860_013764 [Cuscuta australis]|uniref:Uncharacterized protein n=1 Tax=Cuscuta australis TaxID=267555 RepID=A0A328DL47_9ASTE|nr:hypothetical protein DM860_013764 [Cuscuta australis]
MEMVGTARRRREMQKARRRRRDAYLGDVWESANLGVCDAEKAELSSHGDLANQNIKLYGMGVSKDIG